MAYFVRHVKCEMRDSTNTGFVLKGRVRMEELFFVGDGHIMGMASGGLMSTRRILCLLLNSGHYSTALIGLLSI